MTIQAPHSKWFSLNSNVMWRWNPDTVLHNLSPWLGRIKGMSSISTIFDPKWFRSSQEMRLCCMPLCPAQFNEDIVLSIDLPTELNFFGHPAWNSYQARDTLVNWETLSRFSLLHAFDCMFILLVLIAFGSAGAFLRPLKAGIITDRNWVDLTLRSNGFLAVFAWIFLSALQISV